MKISLNFNVTLMTKDEKGVIVCVVMKPKIFFKSFLLLTFEILSYVLFKNNFLRCKDCFVYHLRLVFFVESLRKFLVLW